MFTFINLVWLFSIIGITITVAPAINYFIGPFLVFFTKYGYLIGMFLLNNAVIPFHNIGGFELIGFVFCF